MFKVGGFSGLGIMFQGLGFKGLTLFEFKASGFKIFIGWRVSGLGHLLLRIMLRHLFLIIDWPALTHAAACHTLVQAFKIFLIC